jgi:hypothetical protein
MNRFVPVLIVTVLGVASAACPGRSPGSSPATATPAVKERPPVILITIDTLRPDHMSVYGYARATTPKLEGWAAKGAVFEEAYTYWPKTRGSFVAMMTGRTAGESGYSPKHPELHAFNPTLAETLQKRATTPPPSSTTRTSRALSVSRAVSRPTSRCGRTRR